ncbi:HigA family addiction module antitoxin [Wenzhouxiangella sp. XN24]|uniref:HigA family addiction module antitoxin n=1 Tax=Wenzhouxiangella sp. XN24 TaxID=2713569 RepID=UPI0013EA5D95|nr:HigA family addiction module antitoxin [Wenzhouxiangella sp. XN24]NGX16811.1 HigA family addiction module antidote protein [Wenzhouxiangella sp. XN24]
MMTETHFMSDLAIPPGEYLEEVLADLELNQAELARRMGRPAQAINEIIRGEKAITPETSIQLEKVVGVPAHIWSRLEADFRLIQANLNDRKEAKKEEVLVPKFPYALLAKLGLVEKTNSKIERVENLRSFFGVSSLFNLQGTRDYSPAFRQGSKDGLNHEALAAWLRAGTVLSKRDGCAEYSKKRLEQALPEIRKLTKRNDPSEFFSELRSLLCECGVSLIVIPHFPKTYTNGATFWSGKDRAVVMMSLRGSWADIFWFSLFHELGHILLHDKRSTFLEDGSHHPGRRKQEEEADKFAQVTLIPPAEFQKFVLAGDFSRDAIMRFAANLDIGPGIVTGRLHHEGLLPYTIHHGRVRYRFELANRCS